MRSSIRRLNHNFRAMFDLIDISSNHSAKPVQPVLKRIDQVADYRLVGRLFVEKVLQVQILIRRLNGDSDAAFDLTGTCAGLRAQLLVELYRLYVAFAGLDGVFNGTGEVACRCCAVKSPARSGGHESSAKSNSRPNARHFLPFP